MKNVRFLPACFSMLALVLMYQTPTFAQSSDAISTVAALTGTEAFKGIVADMQKTHQRIVDENILLQQVSAPSFKEEKKAKLFVELLHQSDNSLEVSIDKVGNVLALRKGSGAQTDVVAVATHLDTVFDESTPLEIKREGNRILAPGILDNSRGLATSLAIIRGMKAANVKTNASILFVGSVGEEGLGDLRGVKYLFREGEYKNRISALIAVDSGFPDQVVNEAAGSKRYEIHYRGPGGHSYRAFGSVNPAYALANAIVKFSKIKTPAGTTYSVGLLGGGTSVNAIPEDAWMQVDMRSSSNEDLKQLEAEFLAAVNIAATEENSARSTKYGSIVAEIRLLGDRPSGRTPPESRFVQVALAASKSLGWNPKLDSGSTDANIAMSLNIPAIEVADGVGNFNHSTREYLDVEPGQSLRSLQIPLISILDSAGLTDLRK